MRTIAGLIGVLGALTFGIGFSRASAAEIHIAVAANFTAAAKDIATAFKKQTGDDAILSFGSSGTLYAQITQAAPFDILLSADQDRPKKAISDGLGVPESRFTYAVGKLVLWSKKPGYVRGASTLETDKFRKISIADPAGAPYGLAAVETLKALHVYQEAKPKIVQGTNISQAFQFVDTGNADLGFVALSQLVGVRAGSRWVVDQKLYTPILQDAVLLKKGSSKAAALAFMKFLKGPESKVIIEKYGYETSGGT